MKTTDYLKFNGKIIRHAGNLFKITAASLGKRVLVDCDVTVGPDKGMHIDLIKARTPLSKELRSMIGMNLVT